MSAERLALLVPGDENAPVALPASGLLVVGASSERAGFVLQGQGVDDAHCAIGPIKGGGFAIKDLGSRYGTFVNGKKVAAARLSAGDVVLLGSRRLRVVDADEPESWRAAPATPLAEDARPKSAPEEPPAKAADAAPRGLPKAIGGYRIERVIGRGGMGTVLLAVQESLNRPVALKLLPPRLAGDQEFVRKFQTEARAAAALNHPNVVVVHDVGAADGFHFLSMEYMEKGSLEDRLRSEGRLPWREVLDVLHDAARGLTYAEERRIVHRDVKPANLMQNAAGTIKIADLGLATSVEAEASISDGRRILGTPHFISPEQARGDAVDARSDLYSLGATAYRLLTGRTPFQGETTRDILRGHFTQAPEPPRASVPDLPAALEALVLKLLEKEPAARPQSAAELLTEVDRLRLAADHGVTVARPGERPRLPVVPLAAAGVVVALGAAAVLVLGGREEAVDASEARAPLAGEPTAREEAAAPDDGALFAEPAQGDGPDAAALLEQRMRERNLLAENAYLRLDPFLDRAARADALARLAEEYAGTDAAAKMRAEIGKLKRDLAAAEAAEEAGAAALAATEAELRAAIPLPAPPGELPRPGEELRRARAFEWPEGASPEAAAALLARLEEEITSAAKDAFAEALERADALASEGRFDELEALLADVVARLELPDHEPGKEPAGLDELVLLAEAGRARLARLPEEASAWWDARAAADRALVAEALRGGTLGAALARLDLEGGTAALEGLAPRLATAEARAFADGLSEDLRAARKMQDGLAKAFAGDAWRRRTVLDPRGGRPTAREAVGIDGEGLHVAVSGAPELVPWSAFAGQPAALAQLLKERLSREYTAQEKAGGAALLRITSAQEAARLASQKLDPASKARFSNAECKALIALYEDVEPWALAEPRFARERDAAQVLARVLLDVEEGVWSAAEAGLESLLEAHGDTLLVAFLSDGSRWREDAKEETPQPSEPADPAEPTDADADAGAGEDGESDGAR